MTRTRAFLLAAGLGTRLRPLTRDIPKCLVPIAGRPLLTCWLDLLANAGIRELLINTHAHRAGMVHASAGSQIWRKANGATGLVLGKGRGAS